MAKETNKFSFGKEVNDLLIKMRRVPEGAKVKEVFLWELVLNATVRGDKPRYVWTFEADQDSDLNGGYFTVDEDTSRGDTHDRGTKVTLFLKKDHLEYLDVRKLQELVNKYDKCTCLYPIYILDKPMEEKLIIVDDDKENNKDEDDKLKDEFEDLRKLYVKHLKDKVNNIVISSRVYEITSNLSPDRKTFEINPRHPYIKDLKEKADANPDDEEVKYTILLQFESALINIKLYDRKYGTTFYEQVERHSITY